MRRLLALISMALVGLQGTPQSERGTIAGRITRTDGAEGVSGAQVMLVGPATGPGLNAIISNPLMAEEIAEGANFPKVVLTTEEDGHFRFKDLAAGLYTIRVTGDGYFGRATADGPMTAPMATATVRLAEGQTAEDASIAMARGITISGRVRDTEDRPVPNASVTAFRITYTNGRAVLAAANTKTTDDRGDYRLIWLPPGEY